MSVVCCALCIVCCVGVVIDVSNGGDCYFYFASPKTPQCRPKNTTDTSDRRMGLPRVTTSEQRVSESFARTIVERPIPSSRLRAGLFNVLDLKF